MNLGVAGDRFLTLAIGPDVMPTPMAKEAPAELPKRLLQLLSLHPSSVHQASLAGRNEDMAWQEFLANARRKRDDYGVRAMRIGAVCLDDEDRAYAGLLGAARRRQVSPPHLPPTYCHRISPRANRSSYAVSWSR